MPVISLDWFYVVGNDRATDFMKYEPNETSREKEPTMTVLACIDRSTGMVHMPPNRFSRSSASWVMVKSSFGVIMNHQCRLWHP